MQSLSSTPFIADLHLTLRNRVAALVDPGVDPQVGVILVGENPESVKFVSVKENRAREDGIILSLYHLEEETTTFEDLVQTIGFLATDDETHGIVLQLPLPEKFTPTQLDALIQLIPSHKDVDALRIDEGKNQSPMVLAITSLLDHYQIETVGKRVCVVGKGRLVGAPVAHYFTNLGLQVDAVDEETEKVLAITKEADILITGTGVPDLITHFWVKEGAVVIDCASDVHTDSVGQIASALSPAKGGIGPLTVYWLLNNVASAAEASHE
jgi:methylenetetrahydrofolate dehydrogenase (NADP+)/methenyltetrahydrofolate cyclohydrolase